MNHAEHLLVCLMEECAEVAKDVSKALRFGIDDTNVLQPFGPTNRQRIAQELNDLMAVVKMLQNITILPEEGLWDEEAQVAKMKKVEQFMNYAKRQGVLQ